MTDAGKRLIAGANEALAVARGENPAESVTINGHRYVPAAEIERLRFSLSEARATGRREGLNEAAAIAEEQITYTFPDGSPAVTRPRPDGATIAAAIRAAMEKAAGDPPVGNKDIGERHGDHH